MKIFSLFRKVEPQEVSLPIVGKLKVGKRIGRNSFIWITDDRVSTPKGEICVIFFGDSSGPDAEQIQQWNEIYATIDELKRAAFPKIKAEADKEDEDGVQSDEGLQLEDLDWIYASPLGTKRGKLRAQIGFGSSDTVYQVWFEDGVPIFASIEN
ncbi:hypothetical protein K3175_08750 [Qipengyuania sp. GH1]|uniref:hypothetical protein n=1 Tax=Qipengyuania aestuarii TaxID=2867241 RepID=UPI001C87C369|nr:hypothetical protein [Qipengyuania aestuarii]MBX7535749.1 hypothetical protein [Qipengyuania aestuarii]